MKARALRCGVAIFVWLLIQLSGNAQPLFHTTDSIECLVANSDLVFVGEVNDVHGWFLGGDSRPTVGFKIEEVLKGEAHDRIGVFVTYSSALLADWKDRRCRMLVAVKSELPTTTVLVDLTKGRLGLLASDFTLVREPDEAIRIAKETVRRAPANVRRFHTFDLEVPASPKLAETEWGKYYGTGGYLLLSVLVDERLEQRAIEYLQSANAARRREAAKALRYFKSDQNIERLKALLYDSSWGLRQRAEENFGLEIRVYTVREQAFETLNYWGVNVEKPVITEERMRPDLVTSVTFGLDEPTSAEIKALARFANLRELTYRNGELTDEGLAAIGSLKGLRTLDIAGSKKVTDSGMKHLTGLPALEYLDIVGTRVTVEGLKVLAELKSLKTVRVGLSQLTDEEKSEIAKIRRDLKIEN